MAWAPFPFANALTTFFIVTCEHGGNRIPPAYRPLFRGCRGLLASHRGFDRGALTTARELARNLQAPLVSATVSRLLVDLNRSLGHRALHAERVRALAASVRARIVATYYRPYRQQVEALVGGALARGRRVVHISSHSFTPVLDGLERNADVGLLYDPKRAGERALCIAWSRALRAQHPLLRVRRNYPYRGYNDGLTTFLRTRFPASAYVGVELEINQAFVAAGGARWHDIRKAVVRSFLDVGDAA